LTTENLQSSDDSLAENPIIGSDDREQSSRLLLKSALHVYTRRGYRRMTMENVIAHAGISRPTLYKYFRNKHELVAAALAQEVTLLQERMLTSAESLDTSLYIISRARLEAYYYWCAEHRDLINQIYREIDDPESPAGKVREQFIGMLAQYWDITLRRYGLTPNDSLEIDGLLFVMEQLTIRFLSLSIEEQELQQERFINSILTHNCAYIQQLYDMQAPELRMTPPNELLQVLSAKY